MGEDRRQLYLRAKPIVLAALDLADDERAAYLAQACASDAVLRAEVEWMLQAAETTGSPDFLPSLGVADDSGAHIAAVAPNDYHILRRLGEGGMGVVYLAERTVDAGTANEVRQPVALKFLSASNWPGDEARRRFAEERRILATLNHPHIAHLVDAGRTADDRPYLALEYVDGERIDRWCEQHALPLGARIALFLKVCEAVQYAHGRLVIHRDIKPANILVTVAGEPKLLDFGIARLIDGAGGVAAAQTMTVQRALTLAYASPEQVRGLPLGTAADVWSLGVVLYQLVCGRRPFDLGDTASPLDISNAIVTARVPPPSRQARREKRGERRAVPADIDAIVMKALRRDPTERYASVAEFAQDLRRFQAARPVQARQGRQWYRLRLFARRNRLALSAAAVLLALLVGFIATLERQLHRVQLERDKTQAIAGFMSELFENADPTHARGNNITVREVLDRGASQLRQRTQLDPAVRTAMMLSIGRAYNQLDMGGRAVSLLREASELQQRSGADALERGRVMAALGRAYSMLIDLPSSAKADREALALFAQAPGDHAVEMLRVRINLLYDEIAVLDMPLAEITAQLREIVADFDAGRHADPELRVQAQAAYAMALAAGGDDAGAIASASQALRGAETYYLPDDPARVYYRFVLALVTMRTDPAGSVAMYRGAIGDYDRLIGASGNGMAGMAGLLAYFGGALAQLGQTGESVKALERALHLAEGFAADSPDFHLGTLVGLAQQYFEQGRDADAEALLAPYREQLQQRLASGSAWATGNAADAYTLTGQLALRRGRADVAAASFAQALALFVPALRQVSPESYAAALAGQGEAALAQHRPDQARQALQQLETFNRQGKASPESLRTLDAAWLRVRLALAGGDTAAASSLAITETAIARARWGACSRRALAFASVGTPAKARSTDAGCAAASGAVP